MNLIMKKRVATLCALLWAAFSCTQEPSTISVTGITLDSSSVELTEGETCTLKATISPRNADNQTVIWSSDNASVAKVDQGVVNAVAPGVATITARSDDGGFTDKCKVTVKSKVIPAQGISLNKTVLSLEKGSSETLTATFLPENTTNKTIRWSSSKPSVATVADGVVKAVGVGSTSIIASTEDGGMTAICVVSVIISVSSLSVNPSSLTLKPGEKQTLSVTFAPSDATEREITWSSSDPSVATVEDGVVTAIKSGTTTITASSSNGKTASCSVSVVVPVTGVKVSPQSLTLEQYSSGTITATVQPSDATEKGITWKTSNSSVATVSNGTIQALSPGTATITATTVDGGFSATCSVTVEKERTKATSLSFDGSALFVGSKDSYSLRVSVKPEDAVCNFTWKSSNNDAVSVSGDGEVATVTSNYASTGYATVTVTDQRSGLSTSIKVYSYIESFAWNESSGDTYSSYPLITIPVGGTHQLKYTSSAGSNVLNLFGNKNNFVFYEPTYAVTTPTNITLSPEGLVTGVKNGTTGIKPTGSIPGGGNRVYIRVADSINESEYNDSQDYANTVPYGLPMVFGLTNTSDVDWFKLLMDPNASGYVSVTISVEYSGASSLEGNEGRLCKYSLYDSSMQLWGSGSFNFSNTSATASTTRSVPAGPLYLKVYFDTSYNSGLCPQYSMTLRMTVN